MPPSQRTILHVDFNYFYAQCELFYRLASRGHAFAVGGDEESRHGIILAKDPIAKKAGVKTAETLYAARQKCPGIEIVPANFPLYVKKSESGMEIFQRYTDLRQSYGLDEAYLDVTGCARLFGDGAAISADVIKTTYRELGLTISVGQSFCKVFAKLGSDMAGSNEVVEITRDNFREVAWPRPVSELLYVGPATTDKLMNRGIYTIGDLAKATPAYIKSFLHKPGEILWYHANGEEHSPVDPGAAGYKMETIGNSQTLPRDVVNDDDARAVFYMLGESVAARLRDSGYEAQTVKIGVRSNELVTYTRQMKVPRPTSITRELVAAAMELLHRNHKWPSPIRSMELRAADLVATGSVNYQLSLDIDEEKRDKLKRIETTKDMIRSNYGYHSLIYCSTIKDKTLASTDIKTNNTIFPVGYDWSAVG